MFPCQELLLCARAAAFLGTWPSTFSATVVAQRDARAAPRNSTHFFGFAPGDAPWESQAAPPTLGEAAPSPGPPSVAAEPPASASTATRALRVSAGRVRPAASLGYA